MNRRLLPKKIADLVPPQWKLSLITGKTETIKFMGKPMIREMLRHWRAQAKNLSLQIKNASRENAPPTEYKKTLLALKLKADQKIKTLIRLEKKAKRKPLLPQYRPRQYFKPGDHVVCYVRNFRDAIPSLSFMKAAVVCVGKSIDPYTEEFVIVRYDMTFGRQSLFLSGFGDGYHPLIPNIMHDWEFQYLTENDIFTAFWTDLAACWSDSFDPEKFLHHMTIEAEKKTKEKYLPLKFWDVQKKSQGVIFVPYATLSL